MDPENDNGFSRYLRGGNYKGIDTVCQSNMRLADAPSVSYAAIGLRMVLEEDMKVVVDPESRSGSSIMRRGGCYTSAKHPLQSGSPSALESDYYQIGGITHRDEDLGLRLALSSNPPLAMPSTIHPDLSAILSAIPTDWDLASRAWSDFYEESGDENTAAIIRLTRTMLSDPSETNHRERQRREKLLRQMNVSGIYIPFPSLTYTINNVDFTYQFIPPGLFWFGTPDARKRVYLSQPFWMSTTHITQRQWIAINDNNPSYFNGRRGNNDYGVNLDRPVEQVNWHDCTKFAEELTKQTRIKHQLPSEAQWEHACRACTTSLYHFGNDPEELDQYAWYNANSNNQTQSVGKLKPNAWGLFDIIGNVWTWTRTAYEQGLWERLEREAKEVVMGEDLEYLVDDTNDRVTRGAGCLEYKDRCAVDYSVPMSPAIQQRESGFRMIVDPDLTERECNSGLFIQKGGSIFDIENFGITHEQNSTAKFAADGFRLCLT